MTTASRARSGFTLIEILVAVVLLGLMAGALIPSVLSQVGRGDAARLTGDLVAIENAARSFRVDVRRWPGDLGDLMERPTRSTDRTLDGAHYPDAMLARWRGPYLERVALQNGDLESPAGGTIQGTFRRVTEGSRSHLVVEIGGLRQSQIDEVNAAVDGDDPASGAGRVRRTGVGSAVSPFVLRYYAVALN